MPHYLVEDKLIVPVGVFKPWRILMIAKKDGIIKLEDNNLVSDSNKAHGTYVIVNL